MRPVVDDERLGQRSPRVDPDLAALREPDRATPIQVQGLRDPQALRLGGCFGERGAGSASWEKVHGRHALSGAGRALLGR